MVRIPNRLKRFLSSLTGHLIIGLSLVHLITLPFIFFGILYIVDQSSIDLFLDETRKGGRMLADELQRKNPQSDREEIIQILDSAILSGQVIFAEIEVNEERIRGSFSDEMGMGPFIEDLAFGQHDDRAYYLSFVISMGAPPTQATFRVGYDEQPTQEVIKLSLARTVILVLIYFLVTTGLVLALGHRSVRLLNRLREGSRRVASGQWNQKLIVRTTILDIQDLGSDLEEMRRILVEQSSIVRRTSRILYEQQERLIESEAMATVGEMAPVVAHNIRNPLASIRSSAELLYDDSTDDSSLEMCSDIMYEVDRMDGWLREFLLFSRSRASDLQKPVDLCALFTDSTNNFRRAIQKKGVEIHFDVPRPVSRIYGDAALLREMFNSIVSNSLDAIHEDGRITFSARVDEEKFLTVRIKDTGLGIPAENIEQIYKPFHTSKSSGLGLGLLLVKRIVESHGGTIQISSELGFSTTIQLRFPSVSVARAKILVVEDEDMQAGNIDKFLKKFNYSVKIAHNATSAIDLVSDFKPDIVILELNLPGVEACDLVVRLRESKDDIKIIIISGHIVEGGLENDEWQSIDLLAKTDSVYGILLRPLVFGDIKPLIDKALNTDPSLPEFVEEGPSNSDNTRNQQG